MANTLRELGSMTNVVDDVTGPLIPDPAPRERKYNFISVDDHLVEPRDTFEDRVASKYIDAAPKVVEDESGMEYWLIDGERTVNAGGNAHISWAPEHRTNGPVRFDQIRPGTFDVHARIRDMDIAGVLASLCFPSALWGFAGQRFGRFQDPDAGLEIMRAYNRWIIEAWAGSYPDRLIPSQVTWLRDPNIAADEIRKNAELGFKGVSFSENPEKLGLPSIYSTEWDPFFRACEETETVLNLHVGSSSQTLVPSVDTPLEVLVTLFPLNAMLATCDWLFAKIPVRFPNLKIAMTESGVGWLPMLLDRLSYVESKFHKDNFGSMGSVWKAEDGMTALEALHQSFWFTSFWDPSPFQLDNLPTDRVMFEMDYPHNDSTWPDTQEVMEIHLRGRSREDIERMTFRNASTLYRHSVDHLLMPLT